MGQTLNGGIGADWEPFAQPCALQRFHCLGRMHPLIITVPDVVPTTGLRDHRILSRIVSESRIVVEFSKFDPQLAEHLNVIFNVWLSRLPELEELSLAPVEGTFTTNSPDRSLSLAWMLPVAGGGGAATTGISNAAVAFLSRGWTEGPTLPWDPSARIPSALTRLQLAVPLPTHLLHTITTQLSFSAPHLRVLELIEGLTADGDGEDGLVAASDPNITQVVQSVTVRHKPYEFPFQNLYHLRVTVAISAPPTRLATITPTRSVVRFLSAESVTPHLRDLDIRWWGDLPTDVFVIVPARPLRRLRMVLRPDTTNGASPLSFSCLDGGAAKSCDVDDITVDARALPRLVELIPRTPVATDHRSDIAEPVTAAASSSSGTGMRVPRGADHPRSQTTMDLPHVAQYRMGSILHNNRPRAFAESIVRSTPTAAHRQRFTPSESRFHPYHRRRIVDIGRLELPQRKWALFVRHGDDVLHITASGIAAVKEMEGDPW